MKIALSVSSTQTASSMYTVKRHLCSPLLTMLSIDGVDYLLIGKTNYYKSYELIYYINDVTIETEQVLVEYGATGVATGTYEYGLQRLSIEYVNEAKGYYLYNGTGSVVQTTAQNGSAFLRYTYDPFGNVTSINAPMTVDIDDENPYTYNGKKVLSQHLFEFFPE